MINRYLETTYVSGGRVYPEYDCWGLTRDAKRELFGGVMLPTCAAAVPGKLGAITRAVGDVSGTFGLTLGACKPGSVATAWRGKLCVHVGLVVEVDGRMWVLETDVATGPCLTRVSKFEERYSRVDYYAD